MKTAPDRTTAEDNLSGKKFAFPTNSIYYTCIIFGEINVADEQKNGNLRFTRIPVSINAEYQYKKNKGPCLILDFSEGGIGIETKQIFVEGDLIRVIADLPGKNGGHLDIWCVVRNVQGTKLGLEFEEISHAQREILHSYVYGLLETNDKPKFEPIS